MYLSMPGYINQRGIKDFTYTVESLIEISFTLMRESFRLYSKLIKSNSPKLQLIGPLQYYFFWVSSISLIQKWLWFDQGQGASQKLTLQTFQYRRIHHKTYKYNSQITTVKVIYHELPGKIYGIL